MAEGCCKSEALKSWFRAPLLHLWSVYTLYYWGENMWQFALGLYLVYLEEGILRLAAIFGFTAAGAVLLFGGLLGTWVDRTDRLKAMQVCILVQDFAVIVFSIIVFLVVRYEDYVMGTWSGGLWTLLASIIIMLSIIAQLFGMTFKIAFERDWFVVVADGDSSLLARINAVTRSLDQVCMILAPLVAGQIMTHVSLQVAALIIAGYSAVSVCIKYVLVLRLYKHVPQLAKPKQYTDPQGEEETQSLHDSNQKDSAAMVTETKSQATDDSVLQKWPQSKTDATDATGGTMEENNTEAVSTPDESSKLIEKSSEDNGDANFQNIKFSENDQIPENDNKSATRESVKDDLNFEPWNKSQGQTEAEGQNNNSIPGDDARSDQDHNKDKENTAQKPEEVLNGGSGLINSVHISISNVSVASGGRGTGCLKSLCQDLLVLFTGWRVYARQKVVLAGLGISSLYMTVLAFHTITIGYAYANGITESAIGIMSAFAGVAGILASALYPLLRRKLGLERTGIFGFWFEIGCLTLPLISIWLPGSPFEPGYMQSEHVTESIGCIQTTHAPTAFPYVVNGSVDVVMVTGGAVGTPCVEETQSVVTPSIVVFLIGVILSRIGLWVTDLTITQLFQENVPERERGVVNGVQNSLNMTFEIIKYVLVIILPYVQTYGILVILSYIFVFTGGVLFLVFCWKTNRKALGCHDDESRDIDHDQKTSVDDPNA